MLLKPRTPKPRLVFDPIDDTAPFAGGLNFISISLAVIEILPCNLERGTQQSMKTTQKQFSLNRGASKQHLPLSSVVCQAWAEGKNGHGQQ